MPGIDATRAFLPVRIAVLTVSDTRGPGDDRSGDLLVERLTRPGTGSPTGRSCATTGRRSRRGSGPGSPTRRSTW